MTIVDDRGKDDLPTSRVASESSATNSRVRSGGEIFAAPTVISQPNGSDPTTSAVVDDTQASCPSDEGDDEFKARFGDGPSAGRRTMEDVISEANAATATKQKPPYLPIKGTNGTTQDSPTVDDGLADKEPNIIDEESNKGKNEKVIVTDDVVAAVTHGDFLTPEPTMDDEMDNKIRSNSTGNQQGLLLNEPRFVIEDDEDDVPEMELQQDVYGMFFIEGFRSLSFVYALATYTMQISICVLITLDLLNQKDARPGSRFVNYFKIPLDVPDEVAVAQFLSLIIVFATSDDFISSISMIKCGYPTGITDTFRGATRASYHLSNLLRCSEGLLLICTTFLLVIQTSEVLEIFLNFAAIEFVANLDDVAFQLAHHGFLNQRLERAANKVESVKLRQTRLHLRWLVNSIFAFAFLALLAAFLTVRIRQENGYFFSEVACKKLDVHLGDAVYDLADNVKFDFEGDPKTGAQYIPGSARNVLFLEAGEKAPPIHYAYFSTDYHAEMLEGGKAVVEFNGRPVYWENGVKDPTSGKLYYCENIKAWVFTIEVFFNTTNAMPDQAKKECPNGGWLMQSPVTTEMELEKVPFENWNVWTGQVETVENLSISCMECTRDADCGLIYGDCLDNRTCSCVDGWTGDFCDVEYPYCPALMWIDYGDSSSDYDVYGYYSLGIDYTMYGRPVYSDWLEEDEANIIALFSNRTDNESAALQMQMVFDPEFNFSEVGLKDVYELVCYTGRRWFDLYYATSDLARMSWFLPEEQDLHPYWDDLFQRSTRWFSEPTTSQMPIGLGWYNIRDSDSKGSYGPFGATYVDNVAFECMDTKCREDKRVCGIFGTCTNVTGYEDKFALNPAYAKFSKSTLSNTSSACLCQNNFGGVFCEFSPFEPYAEDQYERFVDNETGVRDEFYPSSYFRSDDYWAKRNISSH